MEPACHQQPSLGRDCLSGLDPGARTRAGIRMDWKFHPWNWLLLDSETAADAAVRSLGTVDFTRDVVLRRNVALGCRCLPMALAHIVAAIGRTRDCRILDLLADRLEPSSSDQTGGQPSRKVGCMDIGRHHWVHRVVIST